MANKKIQDVSSTTTATGDDLLLIVDKSDNNKTKSISIDNFIFDNSIKTVDIDTDAITSDKIATDAITNNEILNGTINNAQLADLTIESGKINTDAITTDKIATGAVTNNEICNNTITSSELATDSVTNNAIEDGSVLRGSLANDAIGSDQIEDQAVTFDKIQTSAINAIKISAADIDTSTIVTSVLNAVCIDTEKICALAVTTEKIAACAITAGKIAAGAITTSKLDACAVTAEKIAAGAITTDKLDANAITANLIAACLITADKLDANSVTADKICAGAVTTDKLDACSINADKICANAITTDKLDANSITADKICANAITTEKLSAGAITTNTLDANAITADKISNGAIASDTMIANGVIKSAALATDFVLSKTVQSPNFDGSFNTDTNTWTAGTQGYIMDSATGTLVLNTLVARDNVITGDFIKFQEGIGGFTTDSDGNFSVAVDNDTMSLGSSGLQIKTIPDTAVVIESSSVNYTGAHNIIDLGVYGPRANGRAFSIGTDATSPFTTTTQASATVPLVVFPLTDAVGGPVSIATNVNDVDYYNLTLMVDYSNIGNLAASKAIYFSVKSMYSDVPTGPQNTPTQSTNFFVAVNNPVLPLGVVEYTLPSFRVGFNNPSSTNKYLIIHPQMGLYAYDGSTYTGTMGISAKASVDSRIIIEASGTITNGNRALTTVLSGARQYGTYS